jgi:Tfp pilus assembly protein PilX
MRRPRYTLRNERGIALVLALMVLLVLTGLVLSYLSVSALEPQISRNLSDSARARYLAEAGIERGFNVLTKTPDWSTLIAGASGGAPWVAVAGLTNTTIGAATNGGTFSVIVRNDNGAADTPITGLTAATVPAMDTSANNDVNGVVILRSTGTFTGANGQIAKTIEVVVRRTTLPPFPGAVNTPGRQDDTFINSTNFDIDGRDYGCTAPGNGCDTASNWATTSNPMKYGQAMQAGTQTNIGTTYEANAESGYNTAAKQANIKGKNTSGTYATGTATVASDNSLNPTTMDQFINLVASSPSTTVLQSTMACPMVLTGASSGSTSTPTLTNGCGTNQTLNLGTRDNPKMVFFKGELDPSSNFTGLALQQGIKGAGILIVQDGDLKNFGNLEWDGIVMVAGNYVGMGLMDSSNTTIRGAAVAYESQSGEAAGYFEFYLGAVNNASIHASKQNIDMVQFMLSMHTITNWREI